MSEVLPINLSPHAIGRGLERMGITEPQLVRLMRTIHRRGARREFMDRPLMRYFDRQLSGRPDALRESVIHDGYLFVIERGWLLTVYPIPEALRRFAVAAARLNRQSQ